MTWTMGRLGSRLSLLFEPYLRRVRHGALGRFVDEPMDLQVGLIDAQGQQRMLPFTRQGLLLEHCEQFDRFNSITFRGHDTQSALRFEFNIHSVFYPQEERLSLMPALFLEMRINPMQLGYWREHAGRPDHVRLFLRLTRPNTTVKAHPGNDMQADVADEIDLSRHARLDLHYDCPIHSNHSVYPLQPQHRLDPIPTVAVHECIASLNPGTLVHEDGNGLLCDLPVTDDGSGIKWRLIWACHVREPVVQVEDHGQVRDGVLHYNSYWKDVQQVLTEAISHRDEYLGHSRRFEKIMEQAPLENNQRHLLNQSFQSYLANSSWVDLDLGKGQAEPWFTVSEGYNQFQSTLDVEYNNTLLYLALWPKLLKMQLRQWAGRSNGHNPSGGCYMGHDLGFSSQHLGPAFLHDMPVEENSNYLLMLQAYTRWTGDRTLLADLGDTVQCLTRYLQWTDRNGDGFPSQGVANTVVDSGPALQLGKRQVYLAIKRLAALRAAADLIGLQGDLDQAHALDEATTAHLEQVEQVAWLGDHYAVCLEKTPEGMVDPRTGALLSLEDRLGWDDYSIYTSNGLLLPCMVGQPSMLNSDHLKQDLIACVRENLSRYGCGHTSTETENVRISQNLWRDMMARYLHVGALDMASRYWDLQVVSNTHEQSMGYTDSYLNARLYYFSRGAVSFGYLLAGPRLVVDRLAPGGPYITVDPSRHFPQRWPLLALADWQAGKVPICVVDAEGNVRIEAQLDNVIVQGDALKAEKTSDGMIG